MSAEDQTEFKRGSLVWARLRGHPHWPGIIISCPDESVKESFKYVLFFGTTDHSWVREKDLLEYSETHPRFSTIKIQKLKTAMNAAKQYQNEIKECEIYRDCTDPDAKEIIRKNLLVNVSNKVKEDENENRLNIRIEETLKRKKNAPGEDSTQYSLPPKKSKMSPSKDVKKKRKRTGKHEANKADLKGNTSEKNPAQSCKASKKPKIAAATKVLKRVQKPSKKLEAKNKTGMKKSSSKGNSAQLRKVKAKPKTSASTKIIREQKRTSKPQVILKKSKICYMPSSGSSFVFPGPSTSSRMPGVANVRLVYDADYQRRSFIRGPLQPIPLTLGFVGIGELAFSLVSHLVKVGIRVLIWNRTASKCSDLVRLGAIHSKTPADLAEESDIVFCSVRGTGPITEVCFGGKYVNLDGIVAGLKRNPKSEKGFVMLSSIRPETSIIISQDFHKANTKYLEAQVLLKSQSENCDIRILCAGSKSLFEKLPNCFSSTKAQFIYISSFLGEASRMKYAHTITHVGYALSLIEALAVLQESEKPVESLSFILDELDNVSPIMRNKVKDIIFHRRDLGGTIRELKDTLKELYEWYPKKPLHLATAAFEALDYASRKGADNSNISAMYDLLV